MKNIKRKIIMAAVMTITAFNYYCCLNIAYASEAEEAAKSVTSPMFVLLNIFVAILQCLGGYFIVKGVGEFSVAYKQNDDTGMWSSTKTIAGGLILVSLRIILKALGLEL